MAPVTVVSSGKLIAPSSEYPKVPLTVVNLLMFTAEALTEAAPTIETLPVTLTKLERSIAFSAVALPVTVTSVRTAVIALVTKAKSARAVIFAGLIVTLPLMIGIEESFAL